MSEERLNELKHEYITKLKRLALVDAGLSYDKIADYERYLTADNEDDIAKQAEQIVSDVNSPDGYADVYDSRGAFKPFDD